MNSITAQYRQDILDHFTEKYYYLKEIKIEKDIEKDEKIKIYTPIEVIKILNQSVIGQHRAKVDAANAICNYTKSMSLSADERPFSNLLLIGPTGVGKTLLGHAIAEIMGKNFFEEKMVGFASPPYVGKHVDKNIIAAAIAKFGGDISKAENCIYFLDEIDKIAKKETHQRDSSGEGVQINLLPLLDRQVLNVELKSGETVKFDSSKALIICAGAFSGIEKNVKKRRETRPRIGFMGCQEQTDINEYYLNVDRSDIMDVGFLPEFVGRIGFISVFNSLSKSELRQILTEPKKATIKSIDSRLRLNAKKVDYHGGLFDYIVDTYEKTRPKEQCKDTNARGLESYCINLFKNMFMITDELCKIKKIPRLTIYVDTLEKLDKLNRNSDFNSLEGLEKFVEEGKGVLKDTGAIS